jgi:type I restriction enzyme S subunit
MSFKQVSIAELGQIITGHTPPTKKREYYGTYALFIKPTDISLNFKYTYDTEEYYSEKAYQKYKNGLVPKGATCVVTLGSVGKKITKAHCDCFTNQSMNAVIPNENFDEEYLFYLLKNNLNLLQVHNNGTASGRDHVSKTTFSNIELLVEMNIEKQRKIGHTLATYDDLIENNQKQIKLLEEAAMRLYKEWFVKLRFPGYETTKIIDGVPEGWAKKSINDLMTFHRGYDLTKNNMLDGSIPVVGSTSIIGYHNEYKIKGPGIVTGRSGSLGTYQLIWDDFWPHNTSLYICDYKNHDIFFLYCLLQTVDFSSLNNGGAIPTLNRNTLSNIIVLEPLQELQEKLAIIVKSFYERILIANKQIQSLRQTRDKLLQKLMSGEIEV